MSLFTLFENLFNRLPSVIKARSNKLATIRKWVETFFRAKKLKLVAIYASN